MDTNSKDIDRQAAIKVLDLLPEMVCELSEDGNFEFINSAWEKQMGYTRRDLLGRSFFDLIHPEDLEKAKLKLAKYPSSQSDCRFSIRYRAKSGNYKWLEWNCSRVDDSGLIYAAARDVTEHETARQTVEESERKYRSLFEEMLSGFALHEIVLDDNGVPVDYITLEANREWERLLHTSRADVIGKKAYQTVPGLDRQWLEIFGRVALTGVPRHYVQYASNLDRVFEGVAFSPRKGQFAVTFLDITEYKKTEEALLQTVQRFNAHMDNSPLAVIEFDPELRIIRWSREAERIFGWTAPEVLGKTAADLKWIYDDDIRKINQHTADLFSGRVRRGLNTNRNYRKDRTVIWCEWYNSTIFGSEGKLTSVLSQVLDITARINAEALLKESEIKFRTIADHTYDWEYWRTPDGSFRYNSPSCERVTGYGPEEFIKDSKLLMNIVHPDDRAKAIDHLSGLHLDHTSFDFRVVTRQGETRWIAHQCQPIFDSEGQWLGQRASNRDITQRIEAEEKLRLSEGRFRNIYNMSPIAIEIYNRDGVLISVNTACCALFGLESADAVKGFNLFTDPNLPPDKVEHLKNGEIIRYEADFDFELVKMRNLYRTSRSGKIILDVIITPIGRKGETSSGFLVQIMDITERKNAEQELLRSREHLRKFSDYLQKITEEERKRLSSEIHDEIGQMLTGLKLDLTWLSRRLPVEMEELKQKSSDMVRLIDATDQVVKRISLELRPVLLDQLGLSAAIDWLVDQFRQRTGIACELNIPENIEIDKDLALDIFRIAQESLTNISRHAQANTVKVTIHQSSRQLNLSIRDNGRGISVDQVNDPHSFGLIGMQERARRWKGNLQVKGSPGRGTTIILKVQLPEK